MLNVAGTRVGIRILAQGQQHISQQLATQLGGGLLSHQRVPANSCTPQYKRSLRSAIHLLVKAFSWRAVSEGSEKFQPISQLGGGLHFVENASDYTK